MPKKKKSGDKAKRRAGQPELLGGILEKYQLEDKGGYITREFQDYGYRLAMELGDEKHKALYIRLAKKEKREYLDRALSFVKDAGAKNPGAMFMWKLGQLRSEEKQTK